MRSLKTYIYALLIILMSLVFLNPAGVGYGVAANSAEKSADTPIITPASTQISTPEDTPEDTPDDTKELRLIEHTVRPNEQLHLLAGYYLLNSRRWTEIRDWNPDKVTNPNIIHPGDVLQIWVAPEWEPPYDLDVYLEEYRTQRK